MRVLAVCLVVTLLVAADSVDAEYRVRSATDVFEVVVGGSLSVTAAQLLCSSEGPGSHVVDVDQSRRLPSAGDQRPCERRRARTLA